MKHILVSLLLVLFVCPVVSAMARTYAIRIPNASPLGIDNTNDGGSLLLLRLPNPGSSAQLIARKVDNSGNKVWETGLRLPLQSEQRIISGSVTVLKDGSSIVAVIRTSQDVNVRYAEEAFFIKLNPIGAIQWQKRFAGNGSDAANLGSVSASPGGGFVAAGGVNVSDGTPGVTAASFDAQGRLRWGKMYTNFSPNLPQVILRTPANTNELIFVSRIQPSGGTLIFKIDSNGKLLWSKRIQGDGLSFVSATVFAGGGCVLLFDHAPSHSIYLIRLNSAGNVVWKRSLRHTVATVASNTRGISVTDNRAPFIGLNITIAGTSDNKGFTAILDAAGRPVSSSHVDAAIDVPGFFTQGSATQGSALFTRTSGGGSLLFQLNSRASVPFCQLFQSASMRTLAPSAVSISNYSVTSTNWIPKQSSVNLRRFTPTSRNDTTLCFNEEIPF